MNLKNVDLNLLVVFDAIYTEKSISRAAQKIGLSQSAVSHALRRLRTLLGDPLFVKSGHGVIPTERAGQIADPVRKSLNILESTISDETSFDETSHKRNFVIAMSDFCEYLLMPKLMGWLDENAPHIRIHVVPADVHTLAEQLINGTTDLALGYLPMLPETFRCQRLFLADWVMVLRESHPLFDKKKITADDVASYPHASFTLRQGRNFKDFDKSLAEHNLTRQVSLEVPHFLTLPKIAQQSNIIVTMPRQLTSFVEQHEGLVLVESPTTLESVQVSQYWHERFQKDAGHSWLRQLISKTLLGNIENPLKK